MIARPGLAILGDSPGEYPLVAVPDLHEGRLLEIGPPAQVLSAPREPDTQRFLRRLLEAGRA